MQYAIDTTLSLLNGDIAILWFNLLISIAVRSWLHGYSGLYSDQTMAVYTTTL